jgi:hypothetical protein
MVPGCLSRQVLDRRLRKWLLKSDCPALSHESLPGQFHRDLAFVHPFSDIAVVAIRYLLTPSNLW